jgi:uncharacterized protein YdbL (DUF1318 family)
MRYTSRKLLLAVALVALATWLLLAHAIDQAMWWNVVQLALGGYLAANVGQKAAEGLADAIKARTGAAS